MAKAGRILITGHRGQLGTDLVAHFTAAYAVSGIDLPETDIRDYRAVRDRIHTMRPDIVLHAAAYTDVDGCESDPDTAMAVNCEGTRNVAMACAELGCRLVYYSTDYVFDGSKGSAYVETDRTQPVTVYGQSKLAGEMAVIEQVRDCAIMRIAWVYGRRGKNFVKTVIRLGQDQLKQADLGEPVTPLKVVDDQYGNPTWTVEIGRQTEAVLNADLQGVLHSTSEGQISWFELAKVIFRNLSMPVQVEPCTTAEFPRPAPRPSRSSLENARLKECGHNLMRDYEEALREFLALHGKELLR